MSPLHFACLKKYLFLLYFLRIISLYIQFKVAGGVFSFIILNISVHLHGFWWEVHCNFYSCSSIVKVPFTPPHPTPWLFSKLCLSLSLCFSEYIISRSRLFCNLDYLMISELPGYEVRCLPLILENCQSLLCQMFILFSFFFLLLIF